MLEKCNMVLLIRSYKAKEENEALCSLWTYI